MAELEGELSKPAEVDVTQRPDLESGAQAVAESFPVLPDATNVGALDKANPKVPLPRYKRQSLGDREKALAPTGTEAPAAEGAAPAAPAEAGAPAAGESQAGTTPTGDAYSSPWATVDPLRSMVDRQQVERYLLTSSDIEQAFAANHVPPEEQDAYRYKMINGEIPPRSWLGKLWDAPGQGYAASKLTEQIYGKGGPADRANLEALRNGGEASRQTQMDLDLAVMKQMSTRAPYITEGGIVGAMGTAVENMWLIKKSMVAGGAGWAIGKGALYGLSKLYAPGRIASYAIPAATTIASHMWLVQPYYKRMLWTDMYRSGLGRDDPKFMDYVSEVGGSVEALLDLAELATMARGAFMAFKPVEKQMGWVLRRSAEEVALRQLTRETMKQMTKRVALSQAAGVLSESAIEGIQDMGHLAAMDLQSTIERRRGNTKIDEITLKDYKDTFQTAFTQSLLPFAITQIPFGAFNLSYNGFVTHRALNDTQATLPVRTADVEEILRQSIKTAIRTSGDLRRVQAINGVYYSMAKGWAKDNPGKTAEDYYAPENQGKLYGFQYSPSDAGAALSPTLLKQEDKVQAVYPTTEKLLAQGEHTRPVAEWQGLLGQVSASDYAASGVKQVLESAPDGAKFSTSQLLEHERTHRLQLEVAELGDLKGPRRAKAFGVARHQATEIIDRLEPIGTKVSDFMDLVLANDTARVMNDVLTDPEFYRIDFSSDRARQLTRGAQESAFGSLATDEGFKNFGGQFVERLLAQRLRVADPKRQKAIARRIARSEFLTVNAIVQDAPFPTVLNAIKQDVEAIAGNDVGLRQGVGTVLQEILPVLYAVRAPGLVQLGQTTVPFLNGQDTDRIAATEVFSPGILGLNYALTKRNPKSQGRPTQRLREAIDRDSLSAYFTLGMAPPVPIHGVFSGFLRQRPSETSAYSVRSAGVDLERLSDGGQKPGLSSAARQGAFERWLEKLDLAVRANKFYDQGRQGDLLKVLAELSEELSPGAVDALHTELSTRYATIAHVGDLLAERFQRYSGAEHIDVSNADKRHELVIVVGNELNKVERQMQQKRRSMDKEAIRQARRKKVPFATAYAEVAKNNKGAMDELFSRRAELIEKEHYYMSYHSSQKGTSGRRRTLFDTVAHVFGVDEMVIDNGKEIRAFKATEFQSDWDKAAKTNNRANWLVMAGMLRMLPMKGTARFRASDMAQALGYQQVSAVTQAEIRSKVNEVAAQGHTMPFLREAIDQMSGKGELPKAYTATLGGIEAFEQGLAADLRTFLGVVHGTYTKFLVETMSKVLQGQDDMLSGVFPGVQVRFHQFGPNDEVYRLKFLAKPQPLGKNWVENALREMFKWAVDRKYEAVVFPDPREFTDRFYDAQPEVQWGTMSITSLDSEEVLTALKEVPPFEPVPGGSSGAFIPAESTKRSPMVQLVVTGKAEGNETVQQAFVMRWGDELVDQVKAFTGSAELANHFKEKVKGDLTPKTESVGPWQMREWNTAAPSIGIKYKDDAGRTSWQQPHPAIDLTYNQLGSKESIKKAFSVWKRNLGDDTLASLLVLKPMKMKDSMGREYPGLMMTLTPGLAKLIDRPRLTQVEKQGKKSVLRGFVDIIRDRQYGWTHMPYVTEFENFSTWVEEAFHSTVFRLSKKRQEKLASILGEASGDPHSWSIDNHEKLAKAFLALLRDGVLPKFIDAKEFVPLFHMVTRELRDVYPQLNKAQLPKMSPFMLQLMEALYDGNWAAARQAFGGPQASPPSPGGAAGPASSPASSLSAGPPTTPTSTATAVASPPTQAPVRARPAGAPSPVEAELVTEAEVKRHKEERKAEPKPPTVTRLEPEQVAPKLAKKKGAKKAEKEAAPETKEPAAPPTIPRHARIQVPGQFRVEVLTTTGGKIKELKVEESVSENMQKFLRTWKGKTLSEFVERASKAYGNELIVAAIEAPKVAPVRPAAELPKLPRRPDSSLWSAGSVAALDKLYGGLSVHVNHKSKKHPKQFLEWAKGAGLVVPIEDVKAVWRVADPSDPAGKRKLTKMRTKSTSPWANPFKAKDFADGSVGAQLAYANEVNSTPELRNMLPDLRGKVLMGGMHGEILQRLVNQQVVQDDVLPDRSIGESLTIDNWKEQTEFKLTPNFWKSRALRVAEAYETMGAKVDAVTLLSNEGKIRLQIRLPDEVGKKVARKLRRKSEQNIMIGNPGEPGVWTIMLPAQMQVSGKGAEKNEAMAAEQRLLEQAERIAKLIESEAPSVTDASGNKLIMPFKGIPARTQAENLAELKDMVAKKGATLDPLGDATFAILKAMKDNEPMQVARELDLFQERLGLMPSDRFGAGDASATDIWDKVAAEIQRYTAEGEELPSPENYAARQAGRQEFTPTAIDVFQAPEQYAYMKFLHFARDILRKDRSYASRSRKRQRGYSPIGTALLSAMIGSPKAIRYLLNLQQKGATDKEVMVFLNAVIDAAGGKIEYVLPGYEKIASVVITKAADGWPYWYKPGKGEPGGLRQQEHASVYMLPTLRRVLALPSAIPQSEQKEVAYANTPRVTDAVQKQALAFGEARQGATPPVVVTSDLVSTAADAIRAGFAAAKSYQPIQGGATVFEPGDAIHLNDWILADGDFKNVLLYERMAVHAGTHISPEDVALSAVRGRGPEILKDLNPEAQEFITEIVTKQALVESDKLFFTTDQIENLNRMGSLDSSSFVTLGRTSTVPDSNTVDQTIDNIMEATANVTPDGQHAAAKELSFLGYYGWTDASSTGETAPQAGAVLTDGSEVYVIPANLYNRVQSMGGAFTLSEKMKASLDGGEAGFIGVVNKAKLEEALSKTGPDVFNDPVKTRRLIELAAKGDKEAELALETAKESPTVAALGIVTPIDKVKIGLGRVDANEAGRLIKEAESLGVPGDLIRLEQREIIMPEDLADQMPHEPYDWRGRRPGRRRKMREVLPLSPIAGRPNEPFHYSKREVRARIHRLQTLHGEVQKRFGIRLEVGKVFFGTRAAESYSIDFGPKLLDIQMANAYHEIGRGLGAMFYKEHGIDPKELGDERMNLEVFKLGLPYFDANTLQAEDIPAVRLRGAHEFFRIQLIDERLAAEVAPQFNFLINSEMAKDEAWQANTKWLRGEMDNLRRTNHWETFASQIDFEGTVQEVLKPGVPTFSQAVIDYFDDQHWLAHRQKELSLGAVTEGQNHKLMFEEMFRVVSGASDVAKAWGRWGFFDKNDQALTDREGKIPRPFAEIVEEVSSRGHGHIFDIYLVANRIVSDFKVTGKHPANFSMEAAEQVVADVQHNPQHAYIVELAEQFNRNFDALEKLLVEEGIYTEEEAKAVALANKAYVPFRRVVDWSDKSAVVKETAHMKKLKGGDRASFPIYPPVEATIANLQDLAQAIMYRRGLVRLADLVDAGVPGTEQFIRKIPPPPFVSHEATIENIKTQLRDYNMPMPEKLAIPIKEHRFAWEKGSNVLRVAGPGVKPASHLLQPGTELKVGKDLVTVTKVLDPTTVEVDSAFTAGRSAGMIRTMKESKTSAAEALLDVVWHQTDYAQSRMTYKLPRFTYVIDEETGEHVQMGGDEHFEVIDPVFWEAMHTSFGGKLSPTPGFLWMMNHALKQGATLAFEFLFKNPLADFGASLIFSQNPPQWGPLGHIADAAAAVYDYNTNSDSMRRYMMSGAGQATMIQAQQIRNSEMIREWRHVKWGDIPRTIVENPREGVAALADLIGPMRNLQRLAVQGETWARLSEFKRAYNQTKSQGWEHSDAMWYAGYRARDITIDFRRAGRKARNWNQVAAFLTATLGGNAKQARAFMSDRANMAKVYRSTFLYFVLPTAAFWMMNHDDPEYQKLAEWEKTTFWHVPVHKFTGGNPGFIRFPKPRGWFDTIFGQPVEMVMDRMAGDAPHALERFKKEMGWQAMLSDTLGMWLPTAVLPVLEVVANFSLFRQANIVGKYDIERPPSQQYSYWTSESAKEIGGLLNVSPAKIDHMIYGYGAGVARLGVQIMDSTFVPLIRKLTSEPAAPKPLPPWKPLLVQVPGIRAFLSSNPLGGARQIKEYYNRYERLQGAKGELRKGNPWVMVEILKDYPELFQMAGRSVAMTEEARRLDHAREKIDGIREYIRATYQTNALDPHEKAQLLSKQYELLTSWATWAIGETPEGKPLGQRSQ